MSSRQSAIEHLPNSPTERNRITEMKIDTPFSAVDISQLFAQFQAQHRKDPENADRSLLERGRESLRQRLHEAVPPDPATMHAGRALLHLLADRSILIPLLEHYLEQPLPVSEEAWARWHHMDNLAMAQQGQQVVDAQQAFLSRALSIFPHNPPRLHRDFPFDPLATDNSQADEPVLHQSCLLPWLIGDATQAECWKETGQGELWLRQFEQVWEKTPATPENRFRRFNILRTAADMNRWIGRPEAALETAARISALADEEAEWENAIRWKVEGCLTELRAYVAEKNKEAIRKTGNAILLQINEFEQRLQPLNPSQAKRLRSFCHNAGLPLRGARQYDLALPLLERAIVLGTRNPWTYLSYAAALWAATHEREPVLAQLRKAACLFPVFDPWNDQNRPPEFENVKDDPDFLQAIHLSCP